jgi:hypothetical protein
MLSLCGLAWTPGPDLRQKDAIIHLMTLFDWCTQTSAASVVQHLHNAQSMSCVAADSEQHSSVDAARGDTPQ